MKHITSSHTTSHVSRKASNRHNQGQKLFENHPYLLPSEQQLSQLIQQIYQAGQLISFSKHQSIRITQWIQKLSLKTSNQVWQQNRLLHLKVLLGMIINRKLTPPFSHVPPEGMLGKISLYDIPYAIRNKIPQLQNWKSVKKTQKQKSRNVSIIYPRPSALSSTVKDLSLSGLKNNYKTSLKKQKQYGLKAMKYRRKIIYDEPIFYKQKQQITQRKNNAKNRNQYQSVKTQSMGITYNKQNNVFRQLLINLDDSITDRNIQFKRNFPDEIQQFKEIVMKNSIEELNHQIRYQCQNKQGIYLLIRLLLYLMSEYENLSSEIVYRQIIQEIIRIGDMMGIDLRQLQIDNVNDKSCSSFEKASDNLKYKCSNSHLQSQQFMAYLQQI